MTDKKFKTIARLVKALWIILVALVLFLDATTVVTNKNEYTMIRQFGKVRRIIDEPGISFKAPFIQGVHKIPKTRMLYDLAPSEVITRDKKNMVVDSFVIWEVTDPLKFIQTLSAQLASAESRIDTIVYNSTKNVISSHTQDEIINGRDGELVAAIQASIGTTMDQYGIRINAVETKQIDLPNANKEAVYERMVSERNNIAAQFTAEGESEATKIRTETDNKIRVMISEAKATADGLMAEGEAEYMRILSDVYNNADKADFYEFVLSLDAVKETMKGKDKTLILDSNSPISSIFNNVD